MRASIVVEEGLFQTALGFTSPSTRAGEWTWATLADGAAQPELFGRRMHDIATLHCSSEDAMLTAFYRAITNESAAP